MTSKKQQQLKCDLCEFKTKWAVLSKSKLNLSQHKKVHHAMKKFACTTCKQQFSFKYRLTRHKCKSLCDNEIVPFETETNEINIETEECIVEPIENNVMVQKVNQTCVRVS